LDRLLREELIGKGVIMDQFLLRDITFTDQYAESVEEKQVAQEGMERTEHEAEQMRNLAAGERDRLKTEAEGRKEQLILEAEGRAKGILLEAEAQAQALTLLGEALGQNRDLLTYEYINKLSPNIRAMLVPNNAPLILPLQDLVDNMNGSPPLTTTIATEAAAPAVSTAPVVTPTLPVSSTPVSVPTSSRGFE
jgi:regulator of protease activity HflC (stomatin/prohibitin superfamily)